ncbi:WDGH domain-containing protein [Cellulomonas timonensis]|uniref:WDGH domain-containing protein n=1 Tax=Cellulomonas timonensis TaxID=1689271 RepID=UPI000832FB57|nr:hypothetical protein [Cellulomonas timonensis]
MTPTIPPSPTVGDVITTAAQLDAVAPERLLRTSKPGYGPSYVVTFDLGDGQVMYDVSGGESTQGLTASEVVDEFGPLTLLHRPDAPPAAPPAGATGATSDGYHTFDELYDYRMLYNAHAARGWLAAGIPVVKSWRHSDGEPCFGGGWFIVTATLPTGQVSNHYKAESWDLFSVPEVELPPEYDGHTPADASDRLRTHLATQPTPAPAVEDREGVRRAVRAIYDVRRARAGLEPISDSDFGRGSGPDAYGDTWDEARAAFLATRAGEVQR